MPTDKQAKTALGITSRVNAGEPLTSQLVIEEHEKNYDVRDGKRSARDKAAIIAQQNLSKPGFLAQLGLTDPQSQEHFKTWLWEGLFGENRMFPRDKQLAIECAKLLAKGAIAQREQVVHSTTGDMDNKSIPELKYFEMHDRWPSPEELQGFILKEYRGSGAKQ